MKSTLNKFLIWSLIIMFAIFISQLRVEWKVEWPQSAMADSKAATWTEVPESEKKNYSKEAEALNKVFTDLAAKLSPAVVNIFTKSKISMGQAGGSPEDLFGFFFGNPGMRPYLPRPQEREAQSLGSGFLINKEGIIVTNSHVIQMNGKNADQVRVKFLKDKEGEEGTEAQIIGFDPSSDVAVLKLKDTKKVNAVMPLGESNSLKVGEWVLAIGNPFGHTHSVSHGIISALGRSSEGLNIRSDFIQTDASINPGNSGGPLINLAGEVIGINTAIDARGPGIGFAIPINVAKNVVKQIIEKGEVTRGWIGVVISNLSPQIARSLKIKDTNGALIQEVAPGGPAEKAGLKSYDVVIGINNKEVNDSRDLTMQIGDMAPGTKAEFKIIRSGKNLSVTLEVGKTPSQGFIAKSFGRQQKPDSSVSRKTGLVLGDLDLQSRKQFNIPKQLNGALIIDVVDGSVASQAGLEPGLVITEVNQQQVRSAADAERAMLKSSRGVLLKVQTANQSAIVSIEF
ncbi:MAG: Do family serine endopeptidase [Proteobacteria bacterium]|nr:Do family serine endopeptidase [Pseudomonadota bacterium]